MEPLQGWGPPPWSLAPKAAALRLALLCLHLRALLSEDRPPCRDGEYPVGAKCCPRCSPGWLTVPGTISSGALDPCGRCHLCPGSRGVTLPECVDLRAAGHRVMETCGETTGTVCAPCSPGTYTAQLNGLDECLPCHLCDPDTGLVTRRKCSSTRNTVCGCDRGHFCVLVDGDHCAECRPHSDCRPGQRVQVTGTERQDTLCEDCPPGTFSAGGTWAVCEPWSKCSGLLETEAKPGNNSTDVTCSSSFSVAILCVYTVIPLTVSLGY
ncbi:tumor necrosis factor receptor superfamily member 14-like isoform 2-T5 [Molossus nigricans]